ncbi:MAG TPA: tRNA (guanosine(37)-N1)-methyltransferase TrmD [Armatimonadota bacterium]|nr:tRNA (guanosine(37)-N1)-methyltransferase TrmD [Armatimonadota bacterium]
MIIDILTLFPEMLRSPLEHSILKRARDAGLLDVRFTDIRDYTTDRHRQVDDYPYGGGPGMVMQPDPVFRAVEAVSQEPPPPDRILLFTPLGRRFDQGVARELAECRRLLLICGRYEGIDERVHRHLATDELSIGDYVLTGGEPAALIVIDAVTRLLPGVLGKDESAESETFSEHLLEYPHYTRPPEYRGWRVPEVLLSGDHGAIARWRREQSLERTLRHRPDLFLRHELTPEDLKLLGLTPPKKKRKRS